MILGILFVSGPLSANEADYYFFKAGGGLEAESKVHWLSVTRGYYVNPALDTGTLGKINRTRLSSVREGLSSLSRILGGESFDPHRFYFGYELSVGLADEEDIDSQIDLSTIGKMHYWFDENSTYYGGLGVGFAYNEIRDEDHKINEELYIGGHLFFASEVEIGRRVTIGGEPYYLTFTWAHRSNGGLEEDNTAFNPLYLSITGKF